MEKNMLNRSFPLVYGPPFFWNYATRINYETINKSSFAAGNIFLRLEEDQHLPLLRLRHPPALWNALSPSYQMLKATPGQVPRRHHWRSTTVRMTVAVDICRLWGHPTLVRDKLQVYDRIFHTQYRSYKPLTGAGGHKLVSDWFHGMSLCNEQSQLLRFWVWTSARFWSESKHITSSNQTIIGIFTAIVHSGLLFPCQEIRQPVGRWPIPNRWILTDSPTCQISRLNGCVGFHGNCSQSCLRANDGDKHPRQTSTCGIHGAREWQISRFPHTLSSISKTSRARAPHRR